MNSPIWFLALSALFLAALVTLAGLLVRSRQISDANAALSNASRRAEPQKTHPAENVKSGWMEAVSAQISSLGRYIQQRRFGKLLMADEDEVMLDQAGWGHSTGQSIFIGLRVCTAVLLPLLCLFFIEAEGMKKIILLLAGFALGLLAPKFALRSWTKRLRKKVNDELPMFIDLLRLLQSVGFSMDQSLHMLGDKLRPALPVLGRELHIANQGYSRGRSREASLHRIGESFENDDLRGLVQMIVQVHSHGGAVQEPLKQFALRLREKRRMEMKEKVGKLSVKMTVVMMMTLLPALMLTLAGPAIVSLSQVMTKM